ncbi:MAG TPA: hypothetical protein ENH85_02370 [Candidatus Scalindua sp.]|nr:hypothetical protein [Candidatus Scalindua sp.]
MIRKQLASYAHKAWSGWMKYMFEKSKVNDDGTLTIPEWAVKRWTKQMNTDYENLPEDHKKSDLEEADRILRIIKNEG